MSPLNKLNLWQKFKRLLSSKAPFSTIPVTKTKNRTNDTILENIGLEKINNELNDNTNANLEIKADDKDTSDHHLQDKESQEINRQSVSVQNREAQNSNTTPIIDYLKQYLQNKQWNYRYYRPKSSDSQQSHHLSLRMKSKQIDCGYLFRVQEGNSLLAVYGILPFLIPESHQSAAMLLITEINYDMLIGNLEMDVNDGEIRYKNAIDVEIIGIDDKVIEHLLQSVIAMTTLAYEIFSDLISTKDPSTNMPTLLSEIRQQADARTFFLATQFVQ